MDEGTNFHSTEVMLVHDGSTVTMTQYGTLKDTNATFDADISGDNVRLLITPASANTIVKFDRTVVDPNIQFKNQGVLRTLFRKTINRFRQFKRVFIATNSKFIADLGLKTDADLQKMEI